MEKGQRASLESLKNENEVGQEVLVLDTLRIGALRFDFENLVNGKGTRRASLRANKWKGSSY